MNYMTLSGQKKMLYNDVLAKVPSLEYIPHHILINSNGYKAKWCIAGLIKVQHNRAI